MTNEMFERGGIFLIRWDYSGIYAQYSFLRNNFLPPHCVLFIPLIIPNQFLLIYQSFELVD